MDTIYSEQTMQRYHRSEANLPAHLYSIGEFSVRKIYAGKLKSIYVYS